MNRRVETPGDDMGTRGTGLVQPGLGVDGGCSAVCLHLCLLLAGTSPAFCPPLPASSSPSKPHGDSQDAKGPRLSQGRLWLSLA